MIIAHLSDTHFDGGAGNEARAAAVMAYLHRLDRPVDAIVVTGDVAHNGLAEEYRQAAAVLKHPAPVLFCPGNHDVRAAFRSELLDLPAADGPIDLAQEIDGVLFAMCDTTIPGEGGGFLADETLAWLDGVLSGGDGPAFVAFHHPPVDVGMPLLDIIRQTGEDRLAAVLERHPRVSALLCGHVHSGVSTTFAGVPLRIAPGVSSGLLLPADPGGSRNWDEDGGPVDRDGVPAFLFHVLHDDGRVTTHHRTVRLS